jgi:hypothetical protein
MVDALDNRRHVLALCNALSLFRGRDDVASPVVYQGPVFGANVSYEYRGARSWQNGVLYAGAGRPIPLYAGANQPDWGESLLIDAQARYAYHRAVADWPGHRLALYAGGLLVAGFHVLRPNGRGGSSKLSSWALHAGVMAQYQSVSRHLVQAQLFAPFLAQIGRSPWSLRQQSVRGQLTSLNGYRAITARLHYEYGFTSRWSATAAYEMSYASSPKPEPLHILNNVILLGFSLSL